MKKKKINIKKIFACEKLWYLKWWVWVIVLIFIILIPFVINEFYKVGQITGKGYVTLWGAKDVLIFYGSFLTFIGTTALGMLALWQNKNNNKVETIKERIQNITIEATKIIYCFHVNTVFTVVIRKSEKDSRFMLENTNQLISSIGAIYLYIPFKAKEDHKIQETFHDLNNQKGKLIAFFTNYIYDGGRGVYIDNKENIFTDTDIINWYNLILDLCETLINRLYIIYDLDDKINLQKSKKDTDNR